MQNEPNLNNSKIALSAFIIDGGPTLDTWYRGKNEPKTNPFQNRQKHILQKKKTFLLKKMKKNENKKNNAYFWIDNIDV